MNSSQETRERLSQDEKRLRVFLQQSGETAPTHLFFHPSFLCVWLHRWSHHWYRREHRLLARVLWQLNLFLTGADIAQSSDLGGGLVILNPACVVIRGKAGKNLLLVGHAGVGAGLAEKDIGAGWGVPVLGDDVTLCIRSLILGPVKIGHRVRVPPGAVVTRDCPDDMDIPESRVRVFKAWNS